MPRTAPVLIRTIALLTGAVLLAGCAAPPPLASPSPTPTSTSTPEALESSTAGALQAALDGVRATGGFPGAVARVITTDGVWTGTTGTTGVGESDAPTPVHLTRIGSITKTMTATIILQLVGEGLISLDDPISVYVPDAPNGSASLSQLLNMTSGIPSFSLDPAWQEEYFSHPQTVYTHSDMIDAASALPVDGAPGETWTYSNTNYLLLGMVIEEQLDESLADAFEERIFAPLGMDDSTYPAQSAAIGVPHLSGSTDQGQADGVVVDPTQWNPSYAAAAGEVISTVDDLTKWAHALFTGEGVLTPELQQLRRQSILTSPPPNSATAGYGYGWGDRNGWWGHDGEIPGYTTTVFHSYDEDTTVIVVVNSDVKVDGASPSATVYRALVGALG